MRTRGVTPHVPLQPQSLGRAVCTSGVSPAAGFLFAPRQRRVTIVIFSLTPERVRGLNEPRRHVLRQHFLADVVS